MHELLDKVQELLSTKPALATARLGGALNVLQKLSKRLLYPRAYLRVCEKREMDSVIMLLTSVRDAFHLAQILEAIGLDVAVSKRLGDIVPAKLQDASTPVVTAPWQHD